MYMHCFSIRFFIKREEIYKMAEIENSKDLLSVLWSGADILRSKMDANEYKDYLLGIVFINIYQIPF